MTSDVIFQKMADRIPTETDFVETFPTKSRPIGFKAKNLPKFDRNFIFNYLTLEIGAQFNCSILS